ncbi:MAG: rhamnulokinase family protein [Candidatus Velthaea sp.]
MHLHQCIAVDLGAETGRVIIGGGGEDGVYLREIHRFPNRPVRTPDGLHWDVLRIFEEMLTGIELALASADDTIVSIGVDSWGVDYGLFDGRGRLLGNPYHYRDSRTDGIPEMYAERVSAARQYTLTGIAQMSINTLYQLAAQKSESDGALGIARSLLMIPDIMHYWLTGTQVAEFTNASTSGLLGVDGQWADELISAIDIPRRMFGELVEPGTILGPTRSALDFGPRTRALRVVVPATHDTACAVLAAPLHVTTGDDVCAYISSGTWSLLGLELTQPILTEDARLAGFTNERGVAGSVRFLRNIMGLWLIQECRRAWHRDGGDDYSYDDLTARAATVESPGLIVDVDDPELLHPDDMPAAIAAQLARGRQRAERDPVALTRAIFEGLALQYRRSIADAERLAGVRVGAVAIIGGGSRNALLCQLAADACARVVYAGPAEASATGNVLVQGVADHALSDLAQIRDFVKTTARPRIFEPRSATTIDWAARDAALSSLRQSGTPERIPHV